MVGKLHVKTKFGYNMSIVETDEEAIENARDGNCIYGGWQELNFEDMHGKELEKLLLKSVKIQFCP